MSTFPDIDRRTESPMPYEQFFDEALRDFARFFAAFVLMSLLFAGAVYPWKHELAALPFFLLFVGGMGLLAGARRKK